MITFGILILLAIAFYSGARRGFALQIVYTVGYTISLIVARTFYQELATHLELLIPYPAATEDSKMVFFSAAEALHLDKAFYGAVAFLLILFLGWLVTKFVAIFFRKLTFLPVVKQLNTFGGGILNFVVVYVGIFLVLFVLSMVPLDTIQNLFRNSFLASFIVEHTPFFSKTVYDWWVTLMLS